LSCLRCIFIPSTTRQQVFYALLNGLTSLWLIFCLVNVTFYDSARHKQVYFYELLPQRVNRRLQNRKPKAGLVAPSAKKRKHSLLSLIRPFTNINDNLALTHCESVLIRWANEITQSFKTKRLTVLGGESFIVLLKGISDYSYRKAEVIREKNEARQHSIAIRCNSHSRQSLASVR